MEVVRPETHTTTTRPSTYQLVEIAPQQHHLQQPVLEQEVSGEASPVPSWVVPSQAGATTQVYSSQYTTSSHTAVKEGGVVTSAATHHQVIPQQTSVTTTEYVSGGGISGGQKHYVTDEYTTTTVSGLQQQHQQQQQQQQQQQYQVAGTLRQANYQSSVIERTPATMIGTTTTTTTTTTSGASAAGSSTTAAAAAIEGNISISGGEERRSSRVIHHEYGPQRLISETRRVDESRQSVVSERYVEHEILVPKRIVREEHYEEVYVLPKTVKREELIDDVEVVLEKIVEVANPTIVEKIVEIPQIEWVEDIVEEPVYKTVKKQETRHVARHVPGKVEERVTYQTVRKANPVYVPKIVEEKVYVDKKVEVDVKVPVPVEAEVVHEYHLPQLKPRYSKATYPVYLPRFIEVPVATELLREDLKLSSSAFLSQIGALTKNAASLCEIENLAAQIMKSGDLGSELTGINVEEALIKAWQTNSLEIKIQQQEKSAAASYVAGSSVGGGIVLDHSTTGGDVVISARGLGTATVITTDTGSKAPSRRSKKSSKSVDNKAN